MNMRRLVVLLLVARAATAAPVVGRVLDQAGRPVTGARVWVAPETAPEATVSGTTAADGGFRLELPDAYRDDPVLCILAAGADGAVDARSVTWTRPAELALRLGPGTSADGLVVDEQGAPLAEASARLVALGGVMLSAAPDDARWLARTDGQGRFVLRGLPPGAAARLLVTLAGHATGEAMRRVAPAVGPAFELRLPLARVGTGRVTLPNREPASGVRLSLLGDEAVVAADGSIRFDGVPKSPRLSLAWPDNQRWVLLASDVTAADGGQADLVVNAVVAPALRVTGWLRTRHAARPLGGRAVEVTTDSGTPPWRASVLVSPSGRFVANVPAGRCTFRSYYADQPVVVDAQPGHPLPEVDLREDDGPLERVTCRDEKGQPLTQTLVNCAALREGWHTTHRTDDAGVMLVPAGKNGPGVPWQFWTEQPWRLGSVRYATVGAPLTVELRPCPLVELGGSVRRADGSPVVGARVTLTLDLPGRWDTNRLRQLRREAATDAAGAFTFGPLPADWPAELGLAPEAGAAPPPPAWLAPPQAWPALRNAGHVLLRVVRDEAAVAGVVLGLDGRPAAGALVYAEGHSQAAQKADSKGGFRLTGLPDEPFRLVALDDDDALAEQRVERPGGTVRLALARRPRPDWGQAPTVEDRAVAATLLRAARLPWVEQGESDRLLLVADPPAALRALRAKAGGGWYWSGLDRLQPGALTTEEILALVEVPTKSADRATEALLALHLLPPAEARARTALFELVSADAPPRERADRAVWEACLVTLALATGRADAQDRLSALTKLCGQPDQPDPIPDVDDPPPPGYVLADKVLERTSSGTPYTRLDYRVVAALAALRPNHRCLPVARLHALELLVRDDPALAVRLAREWWAGPDGALAIAQATRLTGWERRDICGELVAAEAARSVDAALALVAKEPDEWRAPILVRAAARARDEKAISGLLAGAERAAGVDYARRVQVSAARGLLLPDSARRDSAGSVWTAQSLDSAWTGARAAALGLPNRARWAAEQSWRGLVGRAADPTPAVLAMAGISPRRAAEMAQGPSSTVNTRLSLARWLLATRYERCISGLTYPPSRDER